MSSQDYKLTGCFNTDDPGDAAGPDPNRSFYSFFGSGLRGICRVAESLRRSLTQTVNGNSAPDPKIMENTWQMEHAENPTEIFGLFAKTRHNQAPYNAP